MDRSFNESALGVFQLFLVGLVGLLKTAKADPTPLVNNESKSPITAKGMDNIRAR
jgi:hypothetical protein